MNSPRLYQRTNCVRELGFVGALVDNHLENERFYDDEHFWPVFEASQELDVPIYLHPTFASDTMLEHYKGNYDENVATALSGFGWGWNAETGLHILCLYCSGLFDRYPKLKIIIGHMRELLPFQLERIIRASRMWGRERGLREVLEEQYLDHDKWHICFGSSCLFAADYDDRSCPLQCR
jgi:predicted TIM-barrel fold metal-dependent hydrolase